MAMQSYASSPSRNKATISGPPKGLIAGAMGQKMTPAPKPGKKKAKPVKKGVKK